MPAEAPPVTQQRLAAETYVQAWFTTTAVPTEERSAFEQTFALGGMLGAREGEGCSWSRFWTQGVAGTGLPVKPWVYGP